MHECMRMQLHAYAWRTIATSFIAWSSSRSLRFPGRNGSDISPFSFFFSFAACDCILPATFNFSRFFFMTLSLCAARRGGGRIRRAAQPRGLVPAVCRGLRRARSRGRTQARTNTQAPGTFRLIVRACVCTCVLLVRLPLSLVLTRSCRLTPLALRRAVPCRTVPCRASCRRWWTR